MTSLFCKGKINPQNHHFWVILGVTFLLADFQQCLRRERYLSQKEMTLIYLLFNELSTNYLAFPIKTVQIL